MDALKIIESINAPISVVGVAGMYRTGKSYLMNRVILNRSSGFGVAPTINACTKGIWMWGKPLKSESEDGKITNLIVIDSEGLGAIDQDSTHDCRIFAIVLLISSLFVYNSQGTIDENAINSLSLVINLTKHIHLKSQSGEEVDSDDYSQYFPAFLWVLRDFTLQLVDEEGDSITAKGYLEGALQPQKGFTDEVEQKNRIRRLIQTFFRERDCFTMVRPLTSEEELQSLERKELRDLRPEFIEQVTDLRKRVFKQSRIKMLNGKQLTGEMLSGLLKNYISAINEGAVPNIENAWTYICKSHCHKLMEACFKEYEEKFADKLREGYPTSQDNLEIYHNLLKHEIMQKYKKEAMGEQTKPYLDELKNRIKERFSNAKSDNKADFEKILVLSMKQYYQRVDDKVKSGDFKNYYEYEKELQNMRTHFMDLEPQGPNKLGLINEFLLSKCNDVAHFLIKNSQNELENELAVTREAKERVENDYYSTQEAFNKEKNSLNLKIFELESRKTDADSKNSLLLQKIDSLKAERYSIEEELGKKLEGEKKKHKEDQSQVKQRLLSEEESKRSLEKNIIVLKSEHDKELALLKQSIDFFEKSREAGDRKETSLREEVKELKDSLANESKELKKKYEDQISKLQSELFTVKDTLTEYQNEIDKKSELHMSTCKGFEDKNKTFQNILEEREAAIRDYETKIQNMNGVPHDVEEALRDLRERYDELAKKLEEALGKVREKDERIKVVTGQFKKEKALLEQTLNFQEIQISDLKRQLEENKRLNENALSALEGRGERKGGQTKDIEELRATYEAKLDQLTQDQEKSRQFLNQKIDQLNETIDDITKDKARSIERLEKVLRDLQLKCDTLTDDNRRAQEAVKAIETSKAKELAEVNDRYKSKIEGMEQEIDNLKYKNNTEINIFQTKSEDNMKQLRQFFEGEKHKIEKRMGEDKDKFEKLYNQMKDEYESRITHMNEVFEEQTENLQQEVKELEIQNLANNQRYEQ